MNSIFSSFDALCAEFLGQSVRPSFASNSMNKGAADSFVNSRWGTNKLSSEPMKKKQDGNVEKKKKQRAPRFAPELDGLNCFETIVSFSCC
ncbi:hypothetical protein ERO13_A02G099100v2 [Gossypium hirsutum]|uniref:Uncharacterized protein n=3 Tax=Gossypium TaxID=3633 RepID=A0ABR0R4S3_GOSAR|nr:hypothetical protein ES319_A02G107200v1 [Gossypium barbadense]KAG4211362.1 hypothetical protein ERO13_A02G099100v2 [Gossypium hirsutum]KAK5846098.1 hypothetical protein PVK06_002369 [Gossypium arboreum]TYH28097.1 hypothetical protein ES288_A02G117600v1 [Gossypium darwinii]